MQNNPYPWQESIWNHWQTLIGQNRLHHAILLNAPKGSGEGKLTSLFSKTLLCKQGSAEPCGSCHSCHLFEAGSHPDFHYLQPEESGKKIGIDPVRRICQKAFESSQLGGKRVILVNGADNMGEGAANALLKTLEEPPENCYFVLIAHSSDRVLPTLLSRCSRWESTLPDETLVKSWVENEVNQSIDLEVIRLNRGAPLAAKAFIHEGKVSQHNALIQSFVDFIVSCSDFTPLLKQLGENKEDGLNWLSFLLLDVAKIQQGTREGLVHINSANQLEMLANTMSLTKTFDQLMSLNELISDLRRHSGLNYELMLGDWLTQFDA